MLDINTINKTWTNLPSVVALQNAQWKCRPASTNFILGQIYALQREQRTGPIVGEPVRTEKSRRGGGGSVPLSSAIGDSWGRGNIHKLIAFVYSFAWCIARRDFLTLRFDLSWTDFSS